jgi:hypothetical protein
MDKKLKNKIQEACGKNEALASILIMAVSESEKLSCAVTRMAKRNAPPVDHQLTISLDSKKGTLRIAKETALGGTGNPTILGGTSRDRVLIKAVDGTGASITVKMSFHDDANRPIPSPFLGQDDSTLEVDETFTGSLMSKGVKEYFYKVTDRDGKPFKIKNGNGSDPEIIIDDGGVV